MHRTEVFVMNVTQELDEWEDSRSIGRKRQWFTIDDALSQLALHKPTQQHYLMQLQLSKTLENANTPGRVVNATHPPILTNAASAAASPTTA